MTMNPDRRRMLQISLLAALPALMSLGMASSAVAEDAATPLNGGAGPEQDFDAKTSTWADRYLSTRDPTTIDVPGMGRFANGVGTFLSDDRHDGKPVKVRGLWSNITPNSLQWEQAFSPDGGKHWETNWVMRYARIV